jgi:hypothetical protein
MWHWPLLLAALLLWVPGGPAAALAAGAPTTTTPGSSTQEATAVLKAQPGLTAVVPPAGELTPPNAGWKIDQMDVQVWPEYDERAVLVLMGLSLPADVPLPTTFRFAIPHGAIVAGVAEVDSKGDFKYNYADSYPPVQSGAEWDVVTIQVQGFRSLQIDYYYDPGLPAAAGERSFPLLLQVPVDVGTLVLHVQQPSRATDFRVQPALGSLGKADDGFTYAVGTFSEVKAGSTLGQLVSYSKPDGALSADPGQSGPRQLKTGTVLLAALLPIAVCGVGFLAFRLYRRAERGKRRQPHPETPERLSARPMVGTPPKPPANSAEAASDRGTAVRRFCFSCGEELPKKKARYCPSCGEAQDE